MNNNQIFTGLAGFVVGIVLAMFVFPSWGMTSGPMRGMMNWRYNGNMMGQNVMGNIDQHFIEKMIPHHEDAITMAGIALDKAEHQQIKNLANDVVKTQTAENNLMKKWYKEWFGSEISLVNQSQAHGMMNMGMMGKMPSRLIRLLLRK